MYFWIFHLIQLLTTKYQVEEDPFNPDLVPPQSLQANQIRNFFCWSSFQRCNHIVLPSFSPTASYLSGEVLSTSSSTMLVTHPSGLPITSDFAL